MNYTKIIFLKDLIYYTDSYEKLELDEYDEKALIIEKVMREKIDTFIEFFEIISQKRKLELQENALVRLRDYYYTFLSEAIQDSSVLETKIDFIYKTVELSTDLCSVCLELDGGTWENIIANHCISVSSIFTDDYENRDFNISVIFTDIFK